MNKWKEITNKHQEEYNNFEGKFFAFSEKQFEKGMKKIGLNENDIDKIVSIGCGGYILKSREKAYKNMFDKQHEEIDRLIKEDVTGEGFIKDMFYYALSNLEYCISRDDKEILNYLDLKLEDFKNNKALRSGFSLAKKEYLNACY